MSKTTSDVDIKNELDRSLTNAGLQNELASVATDEPPAMVGKNMGLIALMKSFPEFLFFALFIVNT